MTAKPGNGGLDDPVVSPAEQRERDPCRQPHRSLHHLDLPGGMSACLGAVAVETDHRRALQIAVHVRGDAPGRDTLVEDDVEPHAIRQRRCDNPMQHRPPFEAVSLNRKLTQPGPPRSEAIKPEHASPEVSRRNGKDERGVVLDDVSGARHT